MRTVLATLIALVFCVTAQASYLHMDTGQAAAAHYVRGEARSLDASGSVDRCWRTDARVVQCSYVLRDVCDVNPQGALLCSMTFTTGPSGLEIAIAPVRSVVVVAQHGSDVIAHARTARPDTLE